jgi:hypothetical protein
LGTLNQLSGINSMKNCENMIIERSVMISWIPFNLYLKQKYLIFWVAFSVPMFNGAIRC